MITTPTLGAQLVPIVSSSERERLTGFAAGEAGIPPPPDIDLCVLGGGAMTREAAVGAVTPDAAGKVEAGDIWGFTREGGDDGLDSWGAVEGIGAVAGLVVMRGGGGAIGSFPATGCAVLSPIGEVIFGATSGATAGGAVCAAAAGDDGPTGCGSIRTSGAGGGGAAAAICG